MYASRVRARPPRSLLPRRCALASVALLLAACSPAPARHGGSAAIAGKEVIPLTTVEFSGHRYVVYGDFGLEKPVPLMVHGNARMFLSLTHAVAEEIHGGPVRKVEDYGYSSRGKGLIDIPMMRLGDRRFRNLPQVPVFDFTEDGDNPVEGMLGVAFLTSARAAVDFSNDALILGVARSTGADKRLIGQGYRHVPMKISKRHRVTIDAYFPSIGRVIPITPSTVSTALTLHQPLFAARVPMRSSDAPDLSPSGTSPEEFIADAVVFEVAGAKFESAASFEDLAEYANVPEGELESYGMLGFDWMAQHRAILDYANRTVYFMP